MKKIGFFGGSFDPVHFGHINLALEMVEKHGLDLCLFCPANISPHKQENLKLLPIQQRQKMVELAISDIPQFQITDIESKRAGVSYTVDTLRELKAKNPENQFFIILGLDAIRDFSEWKEPEEILSLAAPLVGLRDCDHLDPSIKYYSFFEKGLTPTRRLDINSTEIRERIKLKKYIRHLVPSKVVDYIYENRIY